MEQVSKMAVGTDREVLERKDASKRQGEQYLEKESNDKESVMDCLGRREVKSVKLAEYCNPVIHIYVVCSL